MRIKQSTRVVKARYFQIAQQIASVEQAVLRIQPIMVQTAGGQAAEDSNIAIILAARLSSVWERLGKTLSK